MATYLFVCKPKWDYELRRGRWSCARKTRAGDRIFVYVTDGVGLCREWRATSDAKPGKRTRDYRCDVARVRVIMPALTLKDLLERVPRDVWGLPHTHFRGVTAAVIPEQAVYRLDELTGGTAGSRGTASQVLSTRYAEGASGQLRAETLKEVFAPATSVRIAAGFFDVKLLSTVLARPRRKSARRDVQLLFNGFRGERLNQQREELMRFAAHLEKQGDAVDVRLVFEPGLFHTKLFLSKAAGSWDALVGSANATTAALGGDLNEEILVRTPGIAESLLRYLDTVSKGPQTRALKDLEQEPEVRGLQGFFRTGSLYFRPQGQIPKTYNPFTMMVSLLTPEDRRKLEVHQFKNSDPGGGIGAFRIDSTGPQSGSANAAAGQSRGEDRFKASVRGFAVETGLGLWVPNAYTGEVDRLCERVANRTSKELVAWRERLEAIGEAVTMSLYQAYLDDVRTFLAEQGIKWNKVLARGEQGPSARYGVSNPFDSYTAFREAPSLPT